MSRTNYQSNIQRQLPAVLIRRRIIYITICIIIVLLLYMESNLLSMNINNQNEDKILLIGNDQDLIINKNINPNAKPISQQTSAKQETIDDNDDQDDESGDINADNNNNMKNMDAMNDSEWDRELRWYHHIEYQQSMFNVTWHTIFDNETDIIMSEIHSSICVKTDYIIDSNEIENTYNLHQLHPNFDTIELIPIPRKFLLYKKRVLIYGKELKFKCNLMENDMIQNAIQSYLPLMFDHRIEFDEKLHSKESIYFTNVEIYIKYTDITTMRQGTDESYSIFIPYNECHTIHITANTIFGVLHSIETLSQLIEYDFDDNMYYIKYIGYIYDYPYYSYRGVSLDTARHFYPIKTIKKFIDSMVYTKFNVFHWHIVDDQSWPYPLQIYPQIFANASYSKQERYSMNDILDIIKYAKLRGLRVIPEFDSPAHVGSLCKVFDICMDQFCTRSSSGLLDPRKSESLQVIYNIYKEIMDIFDDEYIHIGHDEADYKLCFKKNAELKRWVTDNVPKGKKRSKKELGVYYYFLDKTYNFLKKETNKRMIAWDDIWFRLRKKYEIPNDIILMFWRQAWKGKLWEMMDMNFTVIMTEPFYIDLTYNDLKRRYYWDIWMVDEAPKKGYDYQEWWRKNILGGQACVWSERIDISVLDAKLFPDLSAVAENLWLGGEYVKYNNWNNVKKRLKAHRCLLLRRGIGASPIDAKRTTLYRRQPDAPGSCYEQ